MNTQLLHTPIHTLFHTLFHTPIHTLFHTPLHTLLLSLLPFLAAAQLAHPAFRHYTTDDGLPSPEVYEVLQDRRGYLWFGTDHGVSRFNGYEFENFGADQGLRDNVVLYLFEDARGRIWMVSLNERLYYYDYGLDSILTYKHNDLIQQYIVKTMGQLGFYVDSLGTVYRSLAEQGVLRIKSGGESALLPGNYWKGPIIVEAAGQYFISEKAFVTERLRQEQRIPFAYYDKRGLRRMILENTDKINGPSGYWLTLHDQMLLVYVFDFFYVFKDGELEWARPELDFWTISASHDSEGRIYLGGNQRKGLRIYENEAALKNNTYTIQLEGYSVSHILSDRQGGYWFTTVEDGVFYTPELNFNVLDQSSGLPLDNIVSLEIQTPDSIWAATKDGAVVLIDQANNQIMPIARAWGDVDVHELKARTDGSLWLATGTGAFIFDKNGEINKVPIFLNAKNNSHVKKIIFSSQDLQSVFFTRSYGFLKYHIKQWKIDLRSRNLDFHKRITTLFEDSRSQVWVGAIDGLYKLEGDSVITPVKQHPNLSLRVEALIELKDGALVIGTKGAGLLLWKGDSFREIGVAEGLVSGIVENLHVDSAQNIWVGTFEGISKINPDLSVENYTVKDGLPSNEITDIDSYGKRVWAATRRGLIEITDKKATPPARPVLEEIRVNNERRRPENIARLPYAENNLQIRFLSIDYTQGGRIPYRYRLQPKAPWSYGRNRTINYAALAWGHYQFEVQAQNKDGLWSASTYLPFSIRPPFWAAWQFWSLIGLTLAAIAFFFYRNRLRLYRQQLAYQQSQMDYQQLQLEREKERAATEKSINELQAGALRAQMNPHFIFNCLNSIQGFIASGDKIEASRYLARFAKLVRGALRASLESRISLEEEVAMLENYLALEQMRFDRRFRYQIEVAATIDPFDTTIPPLLVQPFVENAIIHGLADDGREGQIDVRYQLADGRLQVSVTDNGIGLTAARERKKGSVSLHKSVGMTLTRRRLELLDQSRREEAVKIEELKDEQGKALGTRVVVDIGVSENI